MIFLVWKFGRDRRYAGSAVDAAYGKDGGPEVSAPLREAETPVEFEPPEGLRPGELGTLIDFEAGTLDVTATIIDLAVRGYLKIEEVEKEWYQFKHDWMLTKLAEGRTAASSTSGRCTTGCSSPVTRSSCRTSRTRSPTRMGKVREQLMDDAMSKGWFTPQAGHGEGAVGSPRHLRARRRGRAHDPAGDRDPCRAARRARDRRRDPAADRVAVDAEAHRQGLRGAAPHARVQAVHRRVGEAPGAVRRARQHLLRVPALRRRVRCDREVGQGVRRTWPTSVDTSSWYVSQHAFNYAVFSSAIDGFATTSAGTLTSSPASSGSSGFSGGGFSGGGGGGGGGGSW